MPTRAKTGVSLIDPRPHSHRSPLSCEMTEVSPPSGECRARHLPIAPHHALTARAYFAAFFGFGCAIIADILAKSNALKVGLSALWQPLQSASSGLIIPSVIA